MRPSRAPKHYTERIQQKLRDSELLKKFSKRIRQSKASSGKWVAHRGYVEYNEFFMHGLRKMGLGHNLVEALSKIPREKKPLMILKDEAGAEYFIPKGKKPLRILEDGAGVGYFLADLKKYLNRFEIPNKTTAITLTKNQHLERKKAQEEIDEIITGKAENFIPNKTFDAIFSVFGSTTYTLSELRKDLLLKFAHSLSKGGIMMVGFHFELKDFQIGIIPAGLSSHPKENRTLPIEKEMKGIEKAFAKRGFNAKFFLIFFPMAQMPNYMLIIQRIK